MSGTCADLLSPMDLASNVSSTVSGIESLDLTIRLSAYLRPEAGGEAVAASLNVSKAADGGGHILVSAVKGSESPADAVPVYELYQAMEEDSPVAYSSFNDGIWGKSLTEMGNDPISQTVNPFLNCWIDGLDGTAITRGHDPDTGESAYQTVGMFSNNELSDLLNRVFSYFTDGVDFSESLFHSKAWVNAETFLPALQTISLMTDLAGSKNTGSASPVDDLSVQVRWENVNQVGTVEIPAEVIESVASEDLTTPNPSVRLDLSDTAKSGSSDQSQNQAEKSTQLLKDDENLIEETQEVEEQDETEAITAPQGMASLGAELISDNGTHSLFFSMFDAYNCADVKGGILYAYDKDYVYRSPEFTAFFISGSPLSIRGNAEESYEFTKTYFGNYYLEDPEKYTDTHVSEVQDLTVDGREGCYYSSAYTDRENGFTHTEYKVFIDCGDEYVEASILCNAGMDEEPVVDETYINDLLSHLRISDIPADVHSEKEIGESGTEDDLAD